ncbi:unnamed protein product [Trichogramma brassicae]|uniref:Uncharacterized protein n=1 Tax=Trichogramma brassicae TaxID=86971 RepID=A0A6H5I218_9HYME|nr:unnamed protein product [Trichogramma brassicae]
MPAMCDHAADGSEKGDTTIDDGIVQDRRGSGTHLFLLGEPPILRDAISRLSYPLFQSRLLRGHTLLASPPELDIFFRTRCLVPSCECGSRFCRRWQVPNLLCRLHLLACTPSRLISRTLSLLPAKSRSTKAASRTSEWKSPRLSDADDYDDDDDNNDNDANEKEAIQRLEAILHRAHIGYMLLEI